MDILSNLSFLDALTLSVLADMCLVIVVMKVITWFIDRDIEGLEKGFDAEQAARRIAYPVLMHKPAYVLPEGPRVSLSTMSLSAITCAAIDPHSL